MKISTKIASGLAGSVLLFAVFLGISRPVNQLRKSFRAVAKGNFNQQVAPLLRILIVDDDPTNLNTPLF